MNLMLSVTEKVLVYASVNHSFGRLARAHCFVGGSGVSGPAKADVDLGSVLLRPLTQTLRHLHLGYFPAQAGG